MFCCSPTNRIYVSITNWISRRASCAAAGNAEWIDLISERSCRPTTLYWTATRPSTDDIVVSFYPRGLVDPAYCRHIYQLSHGTLRPLQSDRWANGGLTVKPAPCKVVTLLVWEFRLVLLQLQCGTFLCSVWEMLAGWPIRCHQWLVTVRNWIQVVLVRIYWEEQAQHANHKIRLR